MTEERLKSMHELLAVQGSNGTWNYDAYMLGMYNGMELMLAIAENRDPVYRSAPDKFLHESTYKEKIISVTEKS